MKKLFIILTVMAVVFGCTEQQHPLLRQVWGLIEVNPESAKVVLAKVHKSRFGEGAYKLPDGARQGRIRTAENNTDLQDAWYIYGLWND